MTEIEYEVREQDLVAFNDHQLQASEVLQKVMRRHQSVVPGIIVALALILFFYYKDMPSAIFVGVIGLVWGFGVPAFLKRSWRNQAHALYTEEEKACALGRYRLRIEPKNLLEINSTGESRMPWSEILRVEATKKHAFIFVSPTTALIVPRSTVSKGDLHEFIKVADQRIEAADPG